MNAVANDIPALTLGTTVQSKTWRAHHYSGHIEVTSLVNAGKRGKTCPIFSVLAPPCQDAAVAPVAPFILDAVLADVSEEAMASALADVSLAGLTLSRGEKRGVDVDAAPKLWVEGPLMDGQFTPREAILKFTWPGSARSPRQDTLVSCRDRKSAATLYDWVKVNRARLVDMNLAAFRAEMDKIGVRIG
jgi:hypothetical protein